MATLTHRPNLINGQLKIEGEEYSPQLLADMAEKFKTEHDKLDKLRWKGVRPCGKNKFGLVFVYEYDGSLQEYDRFVYKLTDILKRRFGNDVTWDIAGRMWTFSS